MAVTTPEGPHPSTPQWETIEQVFLALESPLLAYACRLLGDVGVAEDVVQDAFMKLLPQFQQIRAPQPWLYRTVHNLAVDHQRRTNRIVLMGAPGSGQNDEDDGGSTSSLPASVLDPTDSQPMPDEQIARWEAIGLVRLVLETLDERSRDLVRLRFNEDLSYKEIAERTGLTVGHVGYLLHHAMKAMATELAGTEFTP